VAICARLALKCTTAANAPLHLLHLFIVQNSKALNMHFRSSPLHAVWSDDILNYDLHLNSKGLPL
jgi:hypothetical protein